MTEADLEKKEDDDDRGNDSDEDGDDGAPSTQGSNRSKSTSSKRTSGERSPHGHGDRGGATETSSCDSDDKGKRARTAETRSRAPCQAQEEPTVGSIMSKLRDAGQQCPDDVWTSHVSRVLCLWDTKLTMLQTIIATGQQTNQDLQRLRSLGLTSWEDAVALLEQIKNFALAPPYGFTLESAKQIKAWPHYARFAY